MIRQTIIPFKLEMTRDLITPHAGLALLGEFAVGLRLLQSTDRYLPKPGSGAGYNPSEHTFPLILMLNGGGRSLEDIRQIIVDEGLREILPLKRIPSSDACGDWLRSMGINGGLYGLEINKTDSENCCKVFLTIDLYSLAHIGIRQKNYAAKLSIDRFMNELPRSRTVRYQKEFLLTPMQSIEEFV